MTTIQSLRLDGSGKSNVMKALERWTPCWKANGRTRERCHGPADDARRTSMTRQWTAIIEREGDGYVSLCPELDIASQGATVNEARDNLKEALALFFEEASPTEIDRRLHNEVYVTRVEVAVG